MKPGYILLLAVLAGAGASAQTMSTEITVDRTVAPQERTASPLASVQPALLAHAPLASGLGLGNFEGDAAFEPRLDSIFPYIYTALPERQRYRGYVSAGYFPTYRLGVQAGYKLVDNDEYTLLLSGRYGGMSWHSKAENGRSTVKNNNFDIKLQLFRPVATGSLKLFADFGKTWLDNLTVSATDGSQDYTSALVGAALGWNITDFRGTVHASFDHFGASRDLIAGLDGAKSYRPTIDDIFRIGLKSDFGNLNKIGGFAQVDVAFDWRDGMSLDYRQLGIGAVHGSSDFLASKLQSSNYIVTNVAVGFMHTGRQLRLRAGVRLALGSGSSKDKFNLTPDVEVAWLPIPVASVYVKADGGTYLNSLRERFNRIAYAPAWAVDRLLRVPLRGVAGFAYAPGTGVRFGLEAAYQHTAGSPVLMCETSRYPGDWAPNSIIYYPMVQKGMWFEANVGYTAANFHQLTADLNVRHNVLKTKDGDAVDGSNLRNNQEWGTPDNPDRAAWVVDLSASIRPLEKLTLNLQWQLRTKRRIFSPSAGSFYALKDVNNLALGATYRISERLALELNLENILCRRHLIIPGVQSPGFTGLLSATYRF